MAKRRKRGDGGVSLRKDGRWEGRVVVGYDDKGLPVTKNVLAKTKSDCIAKLKALRDSIQAPAPEQPKPGILLGDCGIGAFRKPPCPVRRGGWCGCPERSGRTAPPRITLCGGVCRPA